MEMNEIMKRSLRADRETPLSDFHHNSQLIITWSSWRWWISNDEHVTVTIIIRNNCEPALVSKTLWPCLLGLIETWEYQQEQGAVQLGHHKIYSTCSMWKHAVIPNGQITLGPIWGLLGKQLSSMYSTFNGFWRRKLNEACHANVWLE